MLESKNMFLVTSDISLKNTEIVEKIINNIIKYILQDQKLKEELKLIY